MSLRSRRAAIAIAAAAAALAAGAVAVAQDRDGEDPERQQVREVPAELERMLAVFRGERSAQDELPANVAAALERAVEAAGANPALSRRAGTGWAVPGDGLVCHADAAGGGCAEYGNIATLGVTVGVRFHHATGFELSGLAHDRVERVTALLADGERAASVRGNAFSVSVPEPPIALRVVDRDGTTRELPLDFPIDRPLAPPGGAPEDRVEE
jgi:hypothetical protein